MASQHIRRPKEKLKDNGTPSRHRTMKNVVKLDNFYHPDQLKEAIDQFVNRYNNQRYHESLSNLTPADVYFGRGELILKRREEIKNQTLKQRKIQYLNQKLLAL
jgi:putative transposase